MSSKVEPYNELLQPVKDPEKSFAVNISELLQNYVKSFVEGTVNFNSAALMIQGSSSIYGKKVEYLHNLATKLYASLLKNKKEEVVKKDTKEKEKQSKESKFADPFCSTDFKLGRNLSCLRKKFAAKNASNRKASKKSDKKNTYIPVDLVPLEEETKGMEIFNVEGKSIGKKLEFTLNKCKVTSEGWLLLPTTSPDLIPTKFSSPDYTIEDEDSDDNMCNDFDDPVPDSSPLDEGYPPSTGCSDTPGSDPCSQGVSSVPSSQGTDEGLGSLPCTPQETGSEPVTETPADDDNAPTTTISPSNTAMEVGEGSEGFVVEGSNQGIEGIENIPLEDADVAPRPRRSMRQALKLCQTPNQPEGNAPAIRDREEVVVVVKRAIQKKNTCNLPSKLKANDTIALYPASEFCARTFFSMTRTYSKNLPHSLEVTSFKNHSSLFTKFENIQKRIADRQSEKKKQQKQNAKEGKETTEVEEDDENEDVEIEGNLDEPFGNDEITTPPLEAADIVIENNPVLPVRVSNNENPLAEDEPIFGDNAGVEPIFDDNAGDGPTEDIDDELRGYDIKELEDSFANAARQQCDLFREDLQKYAQTSEISKKVNQWEALMKPYLEGLSKREEFDINLYGSRILNAFGDSNRKQTITFRNFCKGKEKWEIHRYFMALLPLVNIGNVSIESEQMGNDEDEQDILVTLLSRKMHHKELEEFGHNEGEHP